MTGGRRSAEEAGEEVVVVNEVEDLPTPSPEQDGEEEEEKKVEPEPDGKAPSEDREAGAAIVSVTSCMVKDAAVGGGGVASRVVVDTIGTPSGQWEEGSCSQR